MLELRPNCECCDRDLAVSDPDVYICSFECTWCGECARKRLNMTCPNCSGTSPLGRSDRLAPSQITRRRTPESSHRTAWVAPPQRSHVEAELHRVPAQRTIRADARRSISVRAGRAHQPPHPAGAAGARCASAPHRPHRPRRGP
ncbi:MAG: DUF1272 domain-containing protein [Microbacterium sp.]